MGRLHEDEISIDLDLVRRLVDRSFPDHAALELRALDASGSSNALFRLGDGLLVRVPERWSITEWIDGEPPPVPTHPAWSLTARQRLAHDLAMTIRDLHAVEVPHDARDDESLSWYRGRPLGEVDADFRESLDACRRLPDLDLDLDATLGSWERVLAGCADDDLTTGWYHGDLLGENLLVRDGRLAAVLDFGGLAVGDQAVDLIAAWELLDASTRATFRRALGVDDASRRRSAGWALFVAVVTFPYYWTTMPARCRSRRTLVQAVLDSQDI